MPYQSPLQDAPRLTGKDKPEPYRSPVELFQPPPPEDTRQAVMADVDPAEFESRKPAIEPGDYQLPVSADLANALKDALVNATLGTAGGLAAPYAVDVANTLLRKGYQMAGGDLGMDEADRVALEKIADRLAKDKTTAKDALNRLVDASPKPYYLLDTAGENLVTLGREAARAPGPARDLAKKTLDERQMDQAGRVMGDVYNLIDPTTNYQETVDALLEERRAKSAPLYETANKRGIHVSPAIRKIMETPTGREAMAEAIRIAADEGVDISRTFAGDNPNRFQKLDENMKILHYFKQGLDRRIEKGMQTNMFGEPVHTSESRAWVKNLKTPLLTEIDRLNPDYALARQEYASYSDHLESLAKGRRFMTEDFDVTAKELTDMSPADRQLFRAGAVRALRDMINNPEDGINKVRKIFGSPARREKMKQLFVDPRLFDEFNKRMDQEGKMFRNRETVDRVTKNITAAALSDADESGLDMGFWKQLFKGDILGAGRTGMVEASSRARGMSPNVRQRVGERLFDATKAAQTLKLIEKSGKAAAGRAALLRKIAAGTGLIGGGTGAGIAAMSEDEEGEE